MKKIKEFLKKETVLVISALLAIISVFFVPISPAYLGYMDFSVLGMLFCLMSVVKGFESIGVFERISSSLLSKTHGTRSVTLVLALLSYFCAMLVTNDVALIAFVPLTISVFAGREQKDVIFAVVMETVAANLGSMVTPVGNPQNLYLFLHFNVEVADFLKTTVPVALVGLLLIIVSVLLRKNAELNKSTYVKTRTDKPRFAVYSVLLAVCIITVLRIIPWWVCLIVVLVGFLITDIKILLRIDYMLLLTFVCFFVFVGNIVNIPSVSENVALLVNGRELIAAVLVSQFISNVPAALMLSAFTDDVHSLILGTDIGGLGTIVASLASVISFKLYSVSQNSQKGRYLLVFGIYNVSFLALLLAAAILIY